jgi:glucose-6-phosphate 1-dehydrogenase
LSSGAPITIVIFGISGDLAKRKLLPSLYWLLAAGKLPAELKIVGVARSDVTPESLTEQVPNYIKDVDATILAELSSRMQVVRMDSKVAAEYPKLRDVLDEIEKGARGATRILHLAIPPTVALPIIDAIAEVGLCQEPGLVTRFLVEKPFGSDLASAEELNRRLANAAGPEQVYRIDHYLAKSTWENIRKQRFDDPQLASRWNHEHIERIEIVATETIGIEGRADFYEQTGALRDFIQSHLLELMSLATMESPASNDAVGLQRARSTVLQAVTPVALDRMLEQTRRGQYKGYREEVDNPRSIVETFAALELTINTPRWQDTPIYLIAGKALAQHRSEMSIHFKDGSAPLVITDNYPGAELNRSPEGYERVLLDAINGDQTNFMSAEEVEATWRVVTPVLHEWAKGDEGLELYAEGSDGPKLWEGVS